MATISTDTYLDGGTARTAGEVWTINGCTLTIRTDTRWHANAPASMTGSLGSLNVSSNQGGAIVVDGTKVRLLPFNSGSGTVPAIGTTISQGGVSGYLLGVWDGSWQNAPYAVGAAMPAGGWIKLREVTGGSFSAGALTGISGTAASADITGWIEVALDSNMNISTQEYGNGLIVNGDWYDLGTTNGSRGQVFQVPTNGGGSGTHVFGVQIETAPGSGVYEWYPTASVTLGAATWTTANITTDLRAKFVESVGNGVVRIGSDGTNNIGYLPASGCKVRIPNIFFRTVATASRATNQVPGAVTRANLMGGNYTINGLHSDCVINTSGITTKGYFHNYVAEQKMVFMDNRTALDLDSCCVGGFTGGGEQKLQLDRITNGTINNVKIVNSGYSLGCLQFNTADSLTFNNLEIINFKARTGSAPAVRVGTTLSNTTFNGVKVKGSTGFTLQNSVNVTVNNLDHVDRVEGATTSTAATSSFIVNGSKNIVLNGLTFGEGGQLQNTHPYTAVIASSTTPSNGVKIRNIGTRSSPIDCGTSIGTTGPGYMANFTAGDSNFSFQRIFLTGLRSGVMLSNTTNMAGMMYEDIYVGYSYDFPRSGFNPIYRKLSAANGSATPTANTGLHWFDAFNSDTTGYIKWYATAPSDATAPYNYIVSTPNQGTGFSSGSAQVSLDTINDYVYAEMTWPLKGHTGFQNQAAAMSGANTGLVVYYDLDIGSGYSGTWKLASAANLVAETLNPAGSKLKIKILQTQSGVNSTTLNYVTFFTTSTLTAQVNNQYPLDTNTLSFTGLATGSEVRCYVGTDPATATEIGGVESTAGSTFSFTHSSGGSSGYIMILAMGYQPIYIPYTYKSSDDTILIQPVIDRNYANPT